MEKILTAKQFIIQNKDRFVGLSVDVWLVEFAKLHRKAALEAAAKNAEAIEGWNSGLAGNAASVDKNSILNAYPESNIQ